MGYKMKIEQLPSGSYRIRKTVNGQKLCKVFDHKPTQREIALALAADIDDIAPKTAFKNCALKYIASRSNVLSPSTVGTYTGYVEASLPAWFVDMKISDITPADIQNVINDYAKDHAPKSTRNVHGFISAVFKMYRPRMQLNTTLPQKIKHEPYIPTSDEVKQIIDAAEGSRYSIPFQLGVLGMRRSEICALTLSDLNDNILTINKALVKNKDNKYVLKEMTKTEDGTRDIYIPDSLRNEIITAGYIYEGFPGNLLKALHRYQKQLNIPAFRFHDLRHFYASYAHNKGMSDADIMKSGGWRSDFCMKNVYRHAMKETLQENQKKIAAGILG